MLGIHIVANPGQPRHCEQGLADRSVPNVVRGDAVGTRITGARQWRETGHQAGRAVARAWRRHDGPTWLVALAVYAGWGLTTWYYHALPWWLVAPLGAWLVCWHGSLQHEAVHGHPTRRPWLDALLVYPPLGLWQPYPLYRESHLAHHRDECITAPLDDPESDYVTARDWAEMGHLHRTMLRFHNTLFGRLTLGPLVACARLAAAEARCLRAGDHGHAAAWLAHVAAVAAVLYWTTAVCGISPWAYVAYFAYPGLALTLLRSFAEHRAAAEPARRTVVVEAGPLMSLLYLNNNYHAAHHARPGLAWYSIPAYWRAQRAAILAGNGDYRFGGYGEQFRSFLLRPKGEPVHPLG